MDVVFSFCIVMHGAVVYGKYEYFVMQMLYVCVLCASCGVLNIYINIYIIGLYFFFR